MRTFKDAGGREWKILVTVDSSMEVRQRTNVVLQRMFDEQCKPMGELAADEEKLVQVLWVLCESQAALKPYTDQLTGAEKDAMGPRDFAASLLGDALGAAWEALVRSTADFFTSQAQRDAAHLMLDKISEMAATFSTGALGVIQKINGPQTGTSILNFVTSGLESRASTQAHEQPAS